MWNLYLYELLRVIMFCWQHVCYTSEYTWERIECTWVYMVILYLWQLYHLSKLHTHSIIIFVHVKIQNIIFLLKLVIYMTHNVPSSVNLCHMCEFWSCFIALEINFCIIHCETLPKNICIIPPASEKSKTCLKFLISSYLVLKLWSRSWLSLH